MKKKTKPEQRSGNHLKQDISMMCLIANENTSGSRKLLKKLGKSDAKNHDDLELSLAKLYKDAADKLVVEKEFAEIHPHKDFILKYCENKTSKKEIEPEQIEVQKKEVIEQSEIDPAPAEMIYSNCCGMSGANGQSSCACGCGGASSFTGNNTGSGSTDTKDLMMFGMVAIVSIFGLIVYLKK